MYGTYGTVALQPRLPRLRSTTTLIITHCSVISSHNHVTIHHKIAESCDLTRQKNLNLTPSRIRSVHHEQAASNPTFPHPILLMQTGSKGVGGLLEGYEG